jgi:hypothetical protein
MGLLRSSLPSRRRRTGNQPAVMYLSAIFRRQFSDNTSVIAVWHGQQPEDLERSQPERHLADRVRFCLTQPDLPNFLLRNVQKVPAAFALFRASL